MLRSLSFLLFVFTTALPWIERGEKAETADHLQRTRVRTHKEGNNFKPPASQEAWLARREMIRKRILVSTGLYPMPEKTPLNPQVYGKIERDGYTVEKVVLETLPGFYLTGNLYRPRSGGGKRPAILNPHGHWKTGRFTPDVQARCVGQARMGAIAFVYDMVGFGDSNPFEHRSFSDDELLALGMNLTGLQLWNSIRALDWLLSLPDVDPKRIAVTGASGGATQTFLLSAVDDRVQVSAPVCMVSHHFQGGCVCENSPLLRVGTDNVEIAACFAPKPLILVGATGDWTSQIMERGVPEIRAIYKLFGAEDRFSAVVHNAGHNYNQTSRESVYAFLRQHLWGEKPMQTVHEAAFHPDDEKTLTAWDADHPRPSNVANAAELKKYLRGVIEKQVAGWKPVSLAQWQQARQIIQTGLATMLACNPPSPTELNAEKADSVGSESLGRKSSRLSITRQGTGEQITAWMLTRPARSSPSSMTMIVHTAAGEQIKREKSDLNKIVNRLLQKGEGVLLVEPFLSGQSETIAQRESSQFYATYNRTVLAERVQDILNAVAYARRMAKQVNLVGLGEAGPWVLLARPFAGVVERTAADAARWEWPESLPITHEMALPAARRYGGMKAYVSLLAPSPLFLYNTGAALDVSWLQSAYQLSEAKSLRVSTTPVAADALVEWLTATRTQ